MSARTTTCSNLAELVLQKFKRINASDKNEAGVVAEAAGEKNSGGSYNMNLEAENLRLKLQIEDQKRERLELEHSLSEFTTRSKANNTKLRNDFARENLGLKLHVENLESQIEKPNSNVHSPQSHPATQFFALSPPVSFREVHVPQIKELKDSTKHFEAEKANIENENLAMKSFVCKSPVISAKFGRRHTVAAGKVPVAATKNISFIPFVEQTNTLRMAKKKAPPAKKVEGRQSQIMNALMGA